MSGRDPDAPIPPTFQCPWADPGEHACPAWRCDCFVADYPDDPFGLHPEAYVVLDDIDIVHLRQPDGSCRISVNGQGHLPCDLHPPEAGTPG